MPEKEELSMSAEIINLRRARKAKARSAKERTASQNRALFGMTRGEREQMRQDEFQAKRHLDGLRLERDPSALTGGTKDDDSREI